MKEIQPINIIDINNCRNDIKTRFDHTNAAEKSNSRRTPGIVAHPDTISYARALSRLGVDPLHALKLALTHQEEHLDNPSLSLEERLANGIHMAEVTEEASEGAKRFQRLRRQLRTKPTVVFGKA